LVYIDYDICSCVSGSTGKFCEIYSCGGVYKNESNVCSVKIFNYFEGKWSVYKYE
jgi:hypothetical protein